MFALFSEGIWLVFMYRKDTEPRGETRMILRQDIEGMDMTDVWGKLAGPLPAGVVSWRQDGRPVVRDGKTFARFVPYIEANTVRERLDAVVPGEWDLTLDLLPPLAVAPEDGDGSVCSFKARLQVMGVIREDVGTGRDYKQAATDAFKRAAVRFGVAHELYAYDVNWVQLDGEGRSAKPVEDPQLVYERRYGMPDVAHAVAPNGSTAPAATAPRTTEVRAVDEPQCPKCGGRMWDNRLTKRNPKAPDFKCRDRSCDGVIWPPRPAVSAGLATVSTGSSVSGLDVSPLAADEIPF